MMNKNNLNTIKLQALDYELKLGEVITQASQMPSEQVTNAMGNLGLGRGINLQKLEELERELELGEPEAEPEGPSIENQLKLPSSAMIEQVLNSLGDVYGRPKNDKRLTPLDKRKSWHVTEMWDLHHQIKNRIFLGQKNSEIAKVLNCNPQTVCFVRNSPIVQAQLMVMRRSADVAVGELKQELLELAPKATQVLEQLLEAEGTAQALKAKIAMDILDRVGVSEPKQIQGSVLHLTGDDVERIKQRAVQLGSSAGFVVDAEFQEVPSAA